MSNNKKTVRIFGKNWRDVTNETTAGKIFDLEDVIKCEGDKPRFASNN